MELTSIWLDRRLWILASMTLLCPLAFLRKLDSLKVTSYIALCAIAYLVSRYFRVPCHVFAKLTHENCPRIGIHRPLLLLPRRFRVATTRGGSLVQVWSEFHPESSSSDLWYVLESPAFCRHCIDTRFPPTAFTCAQNIFSVFNELKENTQVRLNKVIATSIGSAAAICKLFSLDHAPANIADISECRIRRTTGNLGLLGIRFNCRRKPH